MPEDRELEQLRTTARRLGIAVDNRWGVQRLQSEIAAKRTVLRGPAV
jgi:ribosomal protein L13E